MNEETHKPNLVFDNETVEYIAQICYETHRTYSKTLGDDSHPAWDELSDVEKESVHRRVKLCLEDHIVLPKTIHESWMGEKFRDGWSYGNVHDIEKKQHPNLLPWSELNMEQKRKALLFTVIVEVFKLTMS